MYMLLCVWVGGCKRVVLAQLSLTACQRVVPNMPHLFRASHGANEHSLEVE